MKIVRLDLGSARVELPLSEEAEVLSMPAVETIADPAAAIERALARPIGCPSLGEIIERKLKADPVCTAVVVISDSTRPVPYRGASGILLPVLRQLLARGVDRERITILVATGTHHPLSAGELRGLLDPAVFAMGIRIRNHDACDRRNLVPLRTAAGAEVLVNREYLTAGIKILTGLVESHFIAGVSGGRKSICPGLIGEETTNAFHSAGMLSAAGARDLNLDGNPCHEQALEVARLADADFIVNVTLDKEYRLTGVFAGDLEQAHRRAFEHLCTYTGIEAEREYDVVLTHGARVGINHYQAVKAGLAALPAIRAGGTLIIAAANTDADPVGSLRYRAVLHLLKLIGPERFLRLINSADWTFVPEQWEVQAWAKILAKIPAQRLLYYSPQFSPADYGLIPGRDGNDYLPEKARYRAKAKNIGLFLARALSAALAECRRQGAAAPRAAVLADGPCGIVRRRQSLAPAGDSRL